MTAVLGGGGGNAVNRMVESTLGVSGVDLWALNTDQQALAKSLAPNVLKIGSKTSRGLGAGGKRVTEDVLTNLP